MLAKADTASGGSAQDEHFGWSVLSDDELWALDALMAKAANRTAWKPELLVSDTLARIARTSGIRLGRCKMNAWTCLA